MLSSNRRVLVVDDDPLIRDLLVTYLGEAGFMVTEAADGLEALDAVRDHEYPVIITDLLMPVIDGFELIERLGHMGVRSKIIVLTGYGSQEAVKVLMEKGAFHFLRKPLWDFRAVELHAQRAVEAYIAEAERDQLRSDLKRAEYRAITDGLTGLYTHRHFYERLAEEFELIKRRPAPVSLFFIDVDHFKRVNDQFGHPTGDAVLRELARLLRQHLRATDYIARYGGEEIAVLLPHTTGDEAVELAHRLRSAVAREWPPEHPRVTFSVGIADYPLCAADGPSLVAAADEALIRAKHRGRNCAVYSGGEEEAPSAEERMADVKARLHASAWATIEEIARHGRGPVGAHFCGAPMEVVLKDVAGRLGLSESETQGVVQAFRLHDLGAVMAGGLQPAAAAFSGPPRRGPDCRVSLTLDLLEAIADIEVALRSLRSHVERWEESAEAGGDGPTIPLVGRLLAVAEACRAATVDPADPHGLADELRRESGYSLDPTVVDAFLDALAEADRSSDTDATPVPTSYSDQPLVA